MMRCNVTKEPTPLCVQGSRQLGNGLLIVLLLAVGVLLSTPAWSATYATAAEPFAWIDPATHTNVAWLNGSGCSGGSAAVDDDHSAELPLGFTFNFGGVDYTTVRVQSNGRLQFNNSFCGFGSANSGTPRRFTYPMPDTRLVRTLRLYGADLDPSAGGTVRYAALGSAPNRMFVVTFSNVPVWNSASSFYNMQAILHENGEFVYQIGVSNNADQGHAQIGWEIDTDDYELVPYTNIGALANTAVRFAAHVPAPLAYYSMDQLQWNGTPGEIIDNSGNGNNGDQVGNAQTVDPGYVCRGGRIPGNNDAIDTNVNVNSGIGSRGTITFWYNNDSNWNSSNKMLADASANLGNGNADKYFFLVKRTNGRLRFRLEDSNDTDLQVETGNNNLAAGTWHHIAITWDINEDADWMQIYVDGNRQATNRGNRTSALNITGLLGNLNSLYLGDNRENGLGGNGYSNNSARGTLDESRLYTDVLSANQIAVDMAQTHACLLGAWYMDEASWNGTADEVQDFSGDGNDGTGMNGVATLGGNQAIPGSPGTCRFGSFDGVDDYIALPGFPDVTNSFTITAWINPNVINKDQRIFVDDETNTGGYAFSLGDGGDGRLRFFSRGVSPISLDSPAVITAGTWYHVAAVHDVSAKTRQLFVNGVPVTAVQTYSGNWGTDPGTASIGGETNGAGSENNPNWRFDGFIDEGRFYAQALSAADIANVMNETRICSSQLDHFDIAHNVDALTCEPTSIVISARDASNNVLTNFAELVNLSTSTSNGDWQFTGVAGDAFGILSPGAADSGQASYQFIDDGDDINDDNGVVVLDLKNTHAEALTITVEAPSIPIASTSAALTFRPFGFRTTPDPLGTQVSGKPFSFTLTAVGQLPTDPGCSVIQEYDGGQQVELWSDYVDPADNPFGTLVDLNVLAGTFSLSTLEATPTSVNVNFTQGVSETLTANYNDAGSIRINAKDEVEIGAPPAGTGSEIVVGGSSFVVRPFGFALSGIGVSETGGAPDANGPVFRRAGQAFNVGIAAVRWQTADDNGSNGGIANDGVPDPRADLSDNAVTQNFGREAGTPLVDITHTLVAPTPGNSGVLTGGNNIGGFTNGATTTSLSWNEVGIIDLTAALDGGDYLAGGQNVVTTLSNAGRFYPNQFNLANTVLTNRSDITGCGDGFTYLDENFTTTFDLRAVNTANVLTQNYTGAFARLDPTAMAQMNYGGTNAGTDLTARLSVTSNGAFNNGLASVSAETQLQRNAGPDGPFSAFRLGIAPSDNDGVIMDSYDLALSGGATTHRQVGQTDLRFGRAVMENAFGSEFLSLKVPLTIEYFVDANNGFAKNGADACSTLAPSDLTLFNNIEAGQTDGTIQITATNSTTATMLDGNAGMAGNQVTAGDANLEFSSPDAPGYTDINLDVSGADYLQFDWNNDGNHDNNPPTARATFGSFRGDDRIIYWQECFSLSPPALCP